MTRNQDKLDALRQPNIGRMFQRASRTFAELALIKLHESGHEGLTLFHTALISNLDLEGNRITTLAQRAGVSKQAMGQLVAELEERGYVERTPDPDDKRASLVKFTEQGWQLCQDAYQIKIAIEDEFTEKIGEAGFKQLWGLLEQLLESKS